MQPLQWEYRPDGLRAPALICAFKGWNDAADAASSAITFVAGALGGQRFATIDPEEFYDFQSTRPQVKLVDGHARKIVWPEVELYEARVPRAHARPGPAGRARAVVRWRTFSKVIVELAEALGDAARGHARGAARRRPAHPPDLGHRAGHRHRRWSPGSA